MALVSVIRPWHLREGIAIREAERRTGLSRNTIRKYLRSAAVEPKFKVLDGSSNLDPFAGKLSARLPIEAANSRKQRGTARQDAHGSRFAGLLGVPGPGGGLREGLGLEERCVMKWGGRSSMVSCLAPLPTCISAAAQAPPLQHRNHKHSAFVPLNAHRSWMSAGAYVPWDG
jgi:hypothetical protein